METNKKRFDSKGKGSSFERLVCFMLSNWLTNNTKSDIFNRNVLSGGQFTASAKQRGTPGDLAAAHPLAWEFLQHFVVECKHRRSLDLPQFLLDRKHKTFLWETFVHTNEQALPQRAALIIAKQNLLPPLLVAASQVIPFEMLNARKRIFVPYHQTHGHALAMLPLADFFECVKPHTFMAEARLRKGLPQDDAD